MSLVSVSLSRSLALPWSKHIQMCIYAEHRIKSMANIFEEEVDSVCVLRRHFLRFIPLFLLLLLLLLSLFLRFLLHHHYCSIYIYIYIVLRVCLTSFSARFYLLHVIKAQKKKSSEPSRRKRGRKTMCDTHRSTSSDACILVGFFFCFLCSSSFL